MDEIAVAFDGPYSWEGFADAPSLFEAQAGQLSGLYVWTFPVGDSEFVYYVGETGRTFAERMLEHFREHCSGGYHLHDPVAFRQGEKRCLWPGRYDRDNQTTPAEFLRRGSDLWRTILDLANLYRFHLAPLQCDRRIRERIEAGIALHLYDQPGVVGRCQDRGIHYSPRWPDELPLSVKIRSAWPIAGLPEVLNV